jgi:glutaminyl-peptide cyclotransferase
MFIPSNKPLLLIFLLSLLFIAPSCNDEQTTQTTATETPSLKPSPVFNADTAYQSIVKQLSFGPRVPGTPAQQQCADWMEQQLKLYCDSVYVQKVTVTQPVTNKTFPCINLIGAINPSAASRVLLLCHWDSRGFADEDPDPKNHTKAIDAADDGASGVAVLIEIARAIKAQKLDIGVDILLSDVEDYGKSEWEKPNAPSSFCLGTRYWAQNPHIYGYRANFGICLDMVGAKNATFALEANSRLLAGDFQKKVWTIASQLGHSSFFVFTDGISTTDDHMEINQYARIPCIDIINATQTGFGAHWHTMNDNINIIDKSTLKAVGETVLGVLYNY